MSSIPPVILNFKDSGKWFSLPTWAEYFISVGKLLAFAPHGDSRILTAIVVPTRAFSAAFVALGMVVIDAIICNRASGAAHFEKLFDFPPGTPVIFRPKPKQVLKGILQEPEEVDGKLWIRVQVQSQEAGGGTFFVDESRALQVQPAHHSGKLPKKQDGKSCRLVNKFVDSLLGEADPVQLGLRSKLVCALVGKKNVLEHEIRRTPLAIHVNGRLYAEGQLQDVLRVNRFVTATQTSRSALLTVGPSAFPERIINGVEVGVIFDGAVGFLKWGEMCPRGHQVVILDRTEPYFDDAVSAVNRRVSQNRLEGATGLPACQAPAGSEILAFREAVS